MVASHPHHCAGANSSWAATLFAQPRGPAFIATHEHPAFTPDTPIEGHSEAGQAARIYLGATQDPRRVKKPQITLELLGQLPPPRAKLNAHEQMIWDRGPHSGRVLRDRQPLVVRRYPQAA
jgi:hypothetical protein